MQKKNRMFNILFIVLLVILLGLISDILFNLKGSKVSIISIKDKLVISTFSSDNIGKITVFDLLDKNKTSIIDDRKVGITGDISSDGSKITYVDALSDADPWQVYLKDIGKKKSIKLTDSEYGKVSPKFLNNKLIYFLTGDSSGLTKIGKLSVDSKEDEIIDRDNKDRQIDCFDVRCNKIIMSSVSHSSVEKNWNDNDGTDKPLTHIIYEMNENGEDLHKIVELQASIISSISYNSDGTKAIFAGLDVNGDSGEGIYELALEDGKITTIINSNTLLNTEVSELANPNIAKISKDESLVYFTAVASNSEEVEIDGIRCYPTSIFSFNINNKKIEQVYNPEIPSFIFDFNIRY